MIQFAVPFFIQKGIGMRKENKIARYWLDNLTRTKFKEVLEELKLKPWQKELVILRHVNGFDNYRISVELNICRKKISTELNKIYDRAYKRYAQKK